MTRYIPDLAGGGYDGVTVRQLLTMTSGVKWNEDYTDPKSDVARMFSEPVPAGQDPTVAYMKKLPRETAPGTKWVYKTGETNLIGVLVERATKKTLADYLSEKMWKPWGMERDAFWMVNPAGHEVSGCCLSVSLRDYARMGLFALSGGKGVVPDGWFAAATSNASAAVARFRRRGGLWLSMVGAAGRALCRDRDFRAEHHDRSGEEAGDRGVERVAARDGQAIYRPSAMRCGRNLRRRLNNFFVMPAKAGSHLLDEQLTRPS